MQVPYHWRVLSVVTLGSLVTGINAGTLNVALPVVVRHFGAGALAAHWVLLSFMLTNTVLLVLCGRLADEFGRRETYLLGYGVFTLASLLLGLSPTIGAVIALRVVQAAGFAMILANATAIIAHAFPPHLLSQGIGCYMSTISIAQVLGPSVGGFLADAAGWRWVFWFNVPFGVAALCWGACTLRRMPRGEREPVDVRGALLLLVWLGGLLLALSEAGSLGWGSPLVLAGLAALAVALPAFWWAQRRASHPLVDLALFRDAGFALANAAAFFHTLARFGIVLVASLFFQAVWRVDAATAGLAVLPVPVAMMVASPLAGALARWLGPRTVAAAGPAMTAAGLATLLVTLDRHVPYPLVAAGLALMGAGSGVFLTANTTAIMARVPRDRLGVVNGMRLTLQNVGNTLGVALSLSMIASVLPTADRPALFTGAVPSGSLTGVLAGYDRAITAMLIMALVSMAAAVAGLAVTRRDPPTAR
ncbi:MFS transporter [Thermomonospora catenispora]|uniref:MFS transporter n=1 Tax=Thermomonospora catenispora TaxID=2493090 RepID=UPI001F4FB93B|nr:MFS transporter [Thermomonospora catenispora]